jgi:hypothetical protein
VVEDRLNREHAGRRHDGYEILNFAVEGYGIVQHLATAERKAFAFDLDALFLAFHVHSRSHTKNHLTAAIRAGTEIPYPDLAAIVDRSGAVAGMEETEIHRRLEPHLDEILLWGLRALAKACRDRGVTPVWVYVPITEEAGEGWDPERFARLQRTAREAGFVIVSLEGAYRDHEMGAIQLAPWDTHANARGHGLLADRLYEALMGRSDLDLGLDRPGDSVRPGGRAPSVAGDAR